MTRLSGHVATGRGEAARFTCLDWVREQMIERLGIDPFPGTLNLHADPATVDAWHAVRTSPGFPINPPTADYCAARAYAVRLNDRVPAGIVVPEVAAYPPLQIEIVAALALRGWLGLRDGDRVTIETCDRVPVRALIFDVDGTLVDSLTAYRVVAERAAAPYGLAISDAIVREALNTTRPFWDLLLPADLADRASAMEALRREAGRLWPDVLREHGRLYGDVAQTLAGLRAQGARLGIVTGSRRGSLDALRRAGVIEWFDAVVAGEDVQRRKPDPEGLLTCAARLGIAAADAAYVGDTPLDVEAAHAAGMRAVAVLCGAGDGALLSAAGADRLVASLGRVPDVVTVDRAA